MAIETLRTVCNRDCPDACGLIATVEDGKLVKLGGDPEHPVTQGFICYRTSKFPELQNSRERLTRPLARRGKELVEVSWEEALGAIADRLLAIRRESGPAAILHYRSGGSLGLVKSVVDYFWELFGPVTVKRGDICSGGGDAAQTTDFGEEESHDLFDILNSKNILLWGKNPNVSNIHILPLLQKAKKAGSRILLIDPVRHKAEKIADRTILVRPGGDFDLAMGAAALLFERGHADPDASFLLRRLREIPGARPLPHSRRMGAGGRREHRGRLGRRLGARGEALLDSGGLGHGPADERLGHRPGARCALRSQREHRHSRRRRVVLLQEARRLRHVVPEEEPAPHDLRAAPRPGHSRGEGPARPRGLGHGGKPRRDAAGRRRTVARALETRELVVVVDPFLTDTGRRAHFVLPTTTLVEDDDLLGAYGHHWLGASTPAVAPPQGVLSDLEIVQALAKVIDERTGEREEKISEKVRGTAREWKERLLSRVAPLGLTAARLERESVRNPFVGKVLFEDRKFPTDTGRMKLVTTLPPVPPEEPGFPLWLFSNSTEKSQSSTWAGGPPDLLTATCHPAAANGFADGDVVFLESALGRLRVRVKLDPGQRRDVVIVPKGGHYDGGTSANALIRARTTDAGEGAAYQDCRVRLTATT